MIQIEKPTKGFLKITDNEYESNRFCIVERLFRNLDYTIIIDFKISMNIDLIFHEAEFHITPTDEKTNFLEALASIEDVKNGIESLKDDDDEKVTFSFEVLLMMEDSTC